METKIEQKISYRFSLIWIVSLLLGLIFLGFFLQGYFSLKLAIEQRINNELVQKKALAETMAEIIHFPIDFNTLKSRLDELKQMPSMENLVYFRVIKPSGDIFSSTINQEIGKRVQNFQMPEETIIDDATFQGDEIKNITARSSLHDAAVQIGFSVQNIASSEQDIIRFLISDMLFFFLLAVCFIVLFKIIIKPIEELTGLCNKMSKGQLITKPIESEIQEVNELTVAFNKMVNDLKMQKGEIEKVNENLEKKVKERTEELENLTAKLEEKVANRTKELQEKIEELEKFQNLAVGRELKMMELKKEIEKIKRQKDIGIGI
ncbi:MAG: hypothetical protein A2Y98_02085 [Candidatus Portnoybacteria bacterium RBG_19FT_COMBO_36_7]|uniref:HAMP domain-containing protein n=1 Tax=Candidatus Portnoybacteria bacterium RBG_19FT_COMBO_36_7 TaxID=1801992 RepID=A0A1G2F6Z2_9BACT|nr:MAG: hypothetical protein A2Y98_02085 [Candidatus Portnoybacteria bacterium RBG_19FT_COMBO_36_7]